MSVDETTWDWLKTAPLPVVLAISLSGFLTLGGWVWSVSADTTQAQRDAAVAVERAQNAKDTADKLADKLEKANDKLDRLIALVAAMAQRQHDNADEARTADHDARAARAHP